MVEDGTEPLITQCPNCQTRFRVVETQLQVAQGRVRCGSCLTVFAGLDHLLWEEPSAYANEQDAQEALDQLLDELNVELAADEVEHSQLPSVTDDLQDSDVDSVTTSEEAILAVKLFDDRESWFDEKSQLYSGHEIERLGPEYAGPEQLTDDLDTEDGNTEPEDAEGENAEAEDPVAENAAVGNAAGENVGLADFPAAASVGTDSGATDDDMPGKGIWDVAELLADTSVAAEDSAAGDLASGLADASALAATSVPASADPSAPALADLSALAPADPSAPALADSLAVQLGVTGDAVSVSFAPEPRRWWVPLVIVLELAALAALIFWFQFASLGRDAQLRPLYATACEWLDCVLPRDLDSLATRKLVVRSHPTVNGALMVDAVILNQAEFTQPFPELELRFTSVEGQLVASRRFQPSEYLDGELSGATEMPALTPIQVELEIVDPGGDAVNYTLNFH